jgi:hypothetical protein
MGGQRVLSVKNPWAYLIMYHGKNIENRKNRSRYTGPLLIHASKISDLGAYNSKYIGENTETINRIFQELRERRGEIEKTNGHILGQIVMEGCVDTPPISPWAELGSPWYYLFSNPRPFSNPLPARGMLGLWPYPAQNLSSAGGEP